MVASKYTYQPRSISVISSDALSTFSYNCSNYEVVSKILNTLTSAQQKQSYFKTSFPCGSNQWIVENCAGASSGGIYAPTVCVNCNDACSGCSGEDCHSTSAVAVSPCDNKDITSPNRITVLSLNYGTIAPAPTLSSVQFIVSKTSIQVNAVLSSSGSLYGAVFRSNSSTTASPSSIESIMIQNFVAIVNGNISTITIAGLDAATFYNIYLLTASPIGIQMSFDKVLKSKHVVKTLCCKEIKSSLSLPFIVQGQSVPKIITITIPRPSSSLDVQINLYSLQATVDGDEYLALSDKQLYPSTINLDSTSSSSIYTASLPAMSQAGMYQYSLSFYGDSMHEYSITYLNSRQINIISLDVPPPAPNVTQAIFSNDGSYIIVSYDSSTNKGGLPTLFGCNVLFNFDGISSST